MKWGPTFILWLGKGLAVLALLKLIHWTGYGLYVLSDLALDHRGLVETLGGTIPREGLGHYVLSAVEIVYTVTGVYCGLLASPVFGCYLLCRFIGGLPFTIKTPRWAGLLSIVLAWSLFQIPFQVWQKGLSNEEHLVVIVASLSVLILSFVRPRYALALHAMLSGLAYISSASLTGGLDRINYITLILGIVAVALPFGWYLWERQQREPSQAGPLPN